MKSQHHANRPLHLNLSPIRISLVNSKYSLDDGISIVLSFNLYSYIKYVKICWFQVLGMSTCYLFCIFNDIASYCDICVLERN